VWKRFCISRYWRNNENSEWPSRPENRVGGVGGKHPPAGRHVDAGVPVAKVLQPHRQTDIPQLQFRDFFEDVGHPVNDRVAHSTVPVRFSAGPDRFHLRPAPLLGQHNHELLAEIGLSDAEIAELEVDGVIGHTPGGAKTTARQ